MTPNYDRPAFSPQPKDRPALLEKRERHAKIRTTDDTERRKCHLRSQGQCEVREQCGKALIRCKRRASQNHHLLGGIGRRNRGRSVLAAHRLQVCERCHTEITAHVLVPCVPTELAERADMIRYERIRG